MQCKSHFNLTTFLPKKFRKNSSKFVHILASIINIISIWRIFNLKKIQKRHKRRKNRYGLFEILSKTCLDTWQLTWSEHPEDVKWSKTNCCPKSKSLQGRFPSDLVTCPDCILMFENPLIKSHFAKSRAKLFWFCCEIVWTFPNEIWNQDFWRCFWGKLDMKYFGNIFVNFWRETFFEIIWRIFSNFWRELFWKLFDVFLKIFWREIFW